MSASDHESAADEPLFNIGVASRLTDIMEATLRVWERRYHFPRSARTAGGHRLYSQQAITRLQWVKLRVEEGMQVSKAILALQHAEKQGSGLYMPPAPPTNYPANQQKEGRTGEIPSLESLHQQFFKTLIAHDADHSNQVLSEATALFPLE